MFLVDVPTEKKITPTQTAPLSAQKGPTCWYYAARMVREFHGKTYRWSPDWNDSPERKVEKLVSSVRKAVTRLDELGDAVAKAQPQGRMQALKNLFDFVGEDPFNVFEGETVAKMFPGIRSWPEFQNKYASSKLDITRIIDSFTTAYFNDIGINFALERYGFTLKPVGILGSSEILKKALEDCGPLVVSGRFSYEMSTMNADNTKFLFIGNKNSDYITLYKSSQCYTLDFHTIVICGVGVHEQDSIVIYKDPNFPANLYATTFAVLTNRFFAESYMPNSLAYMRCAGDSSCTHLAGRTRTVSVLKVVPYGS